MVDTERVETLAEDVREIEATRDGLRRELDGCKELLEAIETAVDGPVGNEAEAGPAETESEAASTADRDSDAAESSEADTPKSKAPEGDDNAESESDDIIVA